MSEQVVMNQVSGELTAVFRAAAQLGRWLADRRREALRQAQLASERQQRAVRAAIESERRLAEPVYRRALDDRFWAEASEEEAAFVYGTAARFATVDPLASMAARRCEQEARDRWGVELREGESEHATDQPITSEDVDAETVETVAPAVDGERTRDWSEALDESAAANRAETASEDDFEQEAREAETSLSALAVVVEQAPEVAQVRGTRVDGSVRFTALDADGEEVPQVSQRLNDAQAAASTPGIVASRMGDRMTDREEFLALASSPLVRAATRPRPGTVQQPQEEDVSKAGEHAAAASAWDSQAARDEWEQQKLRAGLPAEAVRAARTGDLALHEPPAMATAAAPASTSGRRPPAAEHGRKHTLTR